MSAQNNCHTLVILGNGFDRNCGLNSTFNKFLNAYIHPHDCFQYFHGIYDEEKENIEESKNIQNDVNCDLKNMKNHLRYLDYGVHYKSDKSNGKLKTAYVDDSKLFISMINDYDKGRNPNFFNFWMYYLWLLRGINIPLNNILWYDVENQISYLCNSLYKYCKTVSKGLFLDANQNSWSIIRIFDLFFNLDTRNNKIRLYYQSNYKYEKPQYFMDQFLFQIPEKNRRYINRSLDLAIIISFEYCGLSKYLKDHNSSNTHDYDQLFSDFLFRQLEKFEKEFAQYLKINMNEHKGQYYKKRLNGLKKICNKPYSLLTFNYTGKPNDSNCVSYLPIHSDINHCPIIGINDNECQDDKGNDKDFDIFSKECQIVAYDSENKTLIDIIPKNVKCIKIYGHSLSNDDFPYFKKIFDYCQLRNNNIKVVFYYTNYDNDPDHRVKFTQKVFKFMDKYNVKIRKNLWDYHHLEIKELNW